MTGLIDLALLAPPEYRQGLDYEAILAERLARLQVLMTAAGIDWTAAGLDSDPAVILQQADAYRELLVRAALNDTYLATLLPFATGADLDQLGATLHLMARDAGESDTRYRERLVLAAQRLSGGRLAGYQAEAMAVSPAIAAARAWVDRATGEPVVRVAVMEAGGLPDPDLVARVQARLDRDDVRQATDTVIAQPVTLIAANIAVTLIHLPGPTPSVLVDRARAAIDRTLAQRRAPGRSLPRSALIAAAAVDGVERVVLTTPEADLDAAPGDLIDVGTITITTEVRNA